MLLTVLVSKSIQECWFKGSLFEDYRKSIETKEGFIYSLLSCPFCLSYHIPFWLLGYTLLISILLPEPWSLVFKLPIYSLAVTFVVNRIRMVNTDDQI